MYILEGMAQGVEIDKFIFRKHYFPNIKRRRKRKLRRRKRKRGRRKRRKAG